MKANEFIRRLRRLARDRGIRLSIDYVRAKGSHAVISFGSRKTTVKARTKEISPGLLADMLRQLGISKKDLGQ